MAARLPLSLVLLVSLLGCGARISAPRGDAHLAAMGDATRHHHHGRLEEAAQAWEVAAREAERRVDREEAEYRRARAFVRLGHPDEALSILDALARHRPIARRTIRARFEAARLRWEHDPERALRALTWIVEEHPGHGVAGHALRLLLEARRGESPTSRIEWLSALFERVADSDLGDDVLSAKAQLEYDADDRGAAVATLEGLVERYHYPHGQRWDDALARLADFAEEEEDWEGAIAYLERMLSTHVQTIVPGSQTLPGFPAASLRQARIVRDHLDDPERAEAYFRATHDRFPTSRLRDDALYELGAMWLDRRQPERGCAPLREVVENFEVGHARRLAAARLAADCG